MTDLDFLYNSFLGTSGLIMHERNAWKLILSLVKLKKNMVDVIPYIVFQAV